MSNQDENSSALTAIRDLELVPGDAYAALADAGVHHSSSAKDVHLAGMNLQRAGALDERRSQAWSQLRNLEKRLVLDLTAIELEARDPALPLPPMQFAELPDPTLEALLEALDPPAEPLSMAELQNPPALPASPIPTRELSLEILHSLALVTVDLPPPAAFVTSEGTGSLDSAQGD